MLASWRQQQPQPQETHVAIDYLRAAYRLRAKLAPQITVALALAAILTYHANKPVAALALELTQSAGLNPRAISLIWRFARAPLL